MSQVDGPLASTEGRNDSSFIAQYEEPTLLYRFLKSRMGINPLFLPRTLSYRRLGGVEYRPAAAAAEAEAPAAAGAGAGQAGGAGEAADAEPPAETGAGSSPSAAAAERLRRIRELVGAARIRRGLSVGVQAMSSQRAVFVHLRGASRNGRVRGGSGGIYDGVSSGRLAVSLYNEREEPEAGGALAYRVVETRVVNIPVRDDDVGRDAGLRLQFGLPATSSPSTVLVFHFLPQTSPGGVREGSLCQSRANVLHSGSCFIYCLRNGHVDLSTLFWFFSGGRKQTKITSTKPPPSCPPSLPTRTPCSGRVKVHLYLSTSRDRLRRG